jgi:hypothetical protein
MIDLTIATTDIPQRTVTVGPADIIRFERAYNVGVTQFTAESLRYEWLAFLAWAALKREQATALEFDPWVDTIVDLQPVSQGNDDAAASQVSSQP